MTMNSTNQMIMDQGLGSLSVRAFFRFELFSDQVICLSSSRVILSRVSIFLIVLRSSMFSICLSSSRVILNEVLIFLIFSRSIFSSSNIFLVSNSESLIKFCDTLTSHFLFQSRHESPLFNVADRGPSDPILVRSPGSGAAASSLAYIVCLHGRVREKYELWSMNAQGVCEAHLFARVRLFNDFTEDTFRTTFYNL